MDDSAMKNPELPSSVCASVSRVALLALAAASSAAAQGETGFLRGAGKLDVSTSYSFERYDEYELENPTEEFEDAERQILGVYAALGVSDDLDLVFSAAHVRAEAGDSNGAPMTTFDDESDLQDAALQAKWRAYERELGPGRFRWLLAPGVRFPLTDYEDYEDNPLNGLGEGDVALLGRVIAHYDWRGAYAALETGYDVRTGKLDNEIPIHLSLGTTVGNVTFQGFLTNLYALGDTVSNNRQSDERDGYVRLGLGSYVRVTEGFGLSLSVRFSDDGTNDAQGFSIGTVFRL
jgi:hypothetical protein